jgi:Fic family protein
MMARAGHFVQQAAGFKAFVPADFPPRDLAIDASRTRLLTAAHQALGRLVGAADFVPNPDLFIAVYVRREAVLSSQIEGTQGTLDELFQFEVSPEGMERPRDLEEIVNYVRALNRARDRLEDLPLSIRLVREIHADLMAGVRGREREPGEIRRSQNWIGGSTPSNAAFVPPPVHEMWQALDQWEKYLHDDSSDPLIQAALMHAQFETIHPFLDGNGRVGRLLVPLLLQERGLLQRGRALLYPSVYLKLHRDEYYQRLTRIRTDGDWEGWVDFFLEAIRQVAHEGQATIRDVLHLREEHRAMAAADGRAGPNMGRALEALVREPAMTAAILAGRIDVSEVTAMSVINRLSALGLLRETTGRRRNRVFSYEPYLELFSEASFQRRVASAPKPPGLPTAP